MKDKIKTIHLDYDETLASSIYADHEKHADQLIDMYGEHWRGEKFYVNPSAWDMGNNTIEWYVTFKRSWTDDLIKFCRELAGHDNVYILTASVGDYIRWCNKKLELGFDPNSNIFSREDILAIKTNPKFVDTHNILVDNLPYCEHSREEYSKCAFLNNLPREQFVMVNGFEVWREKTGYQADYFEDLKTRILKALEIN
jgi:hypothetical protein